MDDDELEYAELLDDIYGEVSVCGYSFSAGHALWKLDPIVFRMRMLDYQDSQERNAEGADSDD